MTTSWRRRAGRKYGGGGVTLHRDSQRCWDAKGPSHHQKPGQSDADVALETVGLPSSSKTNDVVGEACVRQCLRRRDANGVRGHVRGVVSGGHGGGLQRRVDELTGNKETDGRDEQGRVSVEGARMHVTCKHFVSKDRRVDAVIAVGCDVDISPAIVRVRLGRGDVNTSEASVPIKLYVSSQQGGACTEGGL